MTFYLKPPRGIIPFHTLQNCVEERLKYFRNMSNISAKGMEYLFEDSAFDRAGHFTLRLAAVRNHSFLPFFIKCELKLLELRLESYNGTLVYTFLRNLLRHAKECAAEVGISENMYGFFNALIMFALKMSSRSYRTHVFNDEHVSDNKCKLFALNVPFQYCTMLVSQHLVDLQYGYAKIPCRQWKDLLLSLYHTYLSLAINEMHYSKNVQKALEDVRVQSILHSFINEEATKTESYVSLSNIEEETKNFPLCMQNLQSVLRRNHRLAHEDRFNLSLFLKDIGVSVDDSIMYWKLEYSKESASCTKCTHNWQQEERRYIYGIRHLYGLEGSRKTYYSRSCRYFQDTALSPVQEGGCPFKHFDNDKLKSLLATYLDRGGDDAKKILLERAASPLNACKLYLEVVKKDMMKSSIGLENVPVGVTSCDISFNNPVQYFLLMKSLK